MSALSVAGKIAAGTAAVAVIGGAGALMTSPTRAEAQAKLDQPDHSAGKKIAKGALVAAIGGAMLALAISIPGPGVILKPMATVGAILGTTFMVTAAAAPFGAVAAAANEGVLHLLA